VLAYRLDSKRNVQAQFHADPVDADDFDQSANVGSPGDVSLFRHQYHRGFTNESQKRFDPALFTVVKFGSLRLAFYDGECVSADVIGPKDDGTVDVDPWFMELVAQFGGRVSL
jgi:hypothetical protein